MTAVLHVLLLLLKWFGILLLVLLGLLLFLIVLVLLTPVRYRGSLEKKEEPEEVFTADGLVSWLNPLVRVRLRFSQKKFSYAVRIFGVRLIDSERPKKEKKPKKRVKSELQETQKADKFSGEKIKVAEGDETVHKALTEENESSGEQQEATDGTEKKSILRKIVSFFEKVRAFPKKIKEKVFRLRKQIQLLWHKKEKIGLFLQDEIHLLAMGKAWNTVGKLLRHCLPGKIKGQVYFGTGDPESTGKALAGLGILYAAYGKGLNVTPDFYEKHLIAELAFKGRVRFGTLLGMVLKLIRDKQVKQFWKDWKKLLKVLKQKAE